MIWFSIYFVLLLRLVRKKEKGVQAPDVQSMKRKIRRHVFELNQETKTVEKARLSQTE